MRGEEGGHEAGEAVAAEERAQEGVEVRGGGRQDGEEEYGGAVGEANRGEGRERGDGVGREERREGGIDVIQAARTGEATEVGERDGEPGVCGGGEEAAAAPGGGSSG